MIFSRSEISKLNNAFTVYCQIYAEKYKESDNNEIEFSSYFEERMEKLIERQKKTYFKIINTAVKRVACIIVAILILAGTVISVDALREGIKNFFIEVYEKFSTIVFEKSNLNSTEITVCYDPKYIPDGYIVIDEKKSTFDYIKVFQDSKGSKIFYLQSCIFENGRNLNTEKAFTEEVHGGLYIENSKTKIFIKSDGMYEYYLESDEKLTKEELLKMAQSIS